MEGSAVLPLQPVFRKSTALPFVISTGVKRSGGICSSSTATGLQEEHRPSLCHLDRSEPQWRDLQFFHGNWSLRKSTASVPIVISTEAKRSGEICSSGPFLEMFFSKGGFFSSPWASYWSCICMPFPSSFRSTEMPWGRFSIGSSAVWPFSWILFCFGVQPMISARICFHHAG